MPSPATKALFQYIQEKSPELSAAYEEIYEESGKLKALREFSIYPYLFCPDLGIDNEISLILSQMYICLTLFFRIQDCAVDQPTRKNTRYLLFSNVLMGYLVNLLHRFPSELDEIFERSLVEYSTSSSHEIESHSFCRDSPVDSEILTFHDTTFLGKKFSPLKVPLAAALLHAGRGSLHTVDSLIDTYGIALQLRNDLMDWEEDYRRGQMTYFLSEVITDSFPHEDTWPEVSNLKKAVLSSHAVLKMMTLELQYTIEAATIAHDISNRFSAFFEEQVNHIKQDIQEMLTWKYHLPNTGLITP